MSKAIVYSLFGYERNYGADGFDFGSYLRGFMLNVRLNRLLFPDWKIILETDWATYKAWGRDLFDQVPGVEVEKNENGVRLCEAMLWRLKPAFHWDAGAAAWKYTHILCRDLDSPPTFREAQAVQKWIENDKTLHAICDSVSHTIPLMGGMIGLRPKYFTERMQKQTWSDMMWLGRDISFQNKGTDQDFLNKFVYPSVAQPGNDSITQHYFNGHPNTFLSDYHKCGCEPITGHRENCPENTKVDHLSDDLRESNNICGHIGAAGYYEGPLFRFLSKYKDRFTDLEAIEKRFPANIFYWNWREDLIKK